MRLTNRRAFLAGACTSALAQTPPRIIDAHTHFFDPTRPQGVPWPAKTEAVLYKQTLPRQFQEATRGLGVRGTVVVEASAWLEDNQWVLDLAEDNPVIAGLVGHLDPGKPEFREHLARFTRNRLFRGIRLNGKTIAEGLGNKDFMQDMKRFADAGLALDAIGAPSMFADVATLAKRIGSLRIVIDHLPFYPQPGLQEVAAFPQIYAKVSGVLRKVGDTVPADMAAYKPGLDEVWNVFGPDRLIYASNWPVSNKLAPYGAVLAVVQEYFAAKGKEASEKYFWKNSLTAYRWVDGA